MLTLLAIRIPRALVYCNLVQHPSFRLRSDEELFSRGSQLWVVGHLLHFRLYVLFSYVAILVLRLMELNINIFPNLLLPYVQRYKFTILNHLQLQHQLGFAAIFQKP